MQESRHFLGDSVVPERNLLERWVPIGEVFALDSGPLMDDTCFHLKLHYPVSGPAKSKQSHFSLNPSARALWDRVMLNPQAYFLLYLPSKKGLLITQ